MCLKTLLSHCSIIFKGQNSEEQSSFKKETFMSQNIRYHPRPNIMPIK